MPDVRAVPKVSVVCITYNQEAFIRDALDGFIDQKVDFPVELIIADDASTDSTPAIIREYAVRSPDMFQFRPILREKNVGIQSNLADALSACRGDYIALCEGDDYWVDPLKLTKQVAFLDANLDVSVCFHPVRVRWDDHREPDSEFPPPSLRGKLTIDELIAKNFIQTNSVMYRRLSDYSAIPKDILPLDWYLHVMHALPGRIAMLPDTMAVYRRNDHGVWTSPDSRDYWLTKVPRHAAAVGALLELFPHDIARRRLIAGLANDILYGMSRAVPDEQGKAVMLETITKNPEVALMALEAAWEQRSRVLLGRRKIMRKLRERVRGMRKT